MAAHLRRHVQHLLEDRQRLPRLLHALGRVRLLQKCEQPPTSRSASTDSSPMPSATRFGVPNRLPSSGMREPFGLLEQQRRAAGSQRSVADLRDLQMRVHRDADALEFAALFELFDEVPQIPVFHAFTIERSVCCVILASACPPLTRLEKCSRGNRREQAPHCSSLALLQVGPSTQRVPRRSATVQDGGAICARLARGAPSFASALSPWNSTHPQRMSALQFPTERGILA